MVAMQAVFGDIKKNIRKGNFRGSWFLEGTSEEVKNFNKKADARLKKAKIKIISYSCIHSYRWPVGFSPLQLGEPSRAESQCYLLYIELGVLKGTTFGSTSATKRNN